MRNILAITGVAILWLTSCATNTEVTRYDVIIRNGMIHDGSGALAFAGDVAVKGDRIAKIGDLGGATAPLVVDAGGQAVAPGFINMLSWAVEDLIIDGRGLGDITQGVTLEVFGEGVSYGPLNDEMKARMVERQHDFKYEIDWTSLGDYLEFLEERGVSPNVASFVGATTLRVHEIGYEDRAASATELKRMQALVHDAMKEGALGVGSSLIYAPANFASTGELIALASAAGEHRGMYISHLRSEAGAFVEAVDELIEIAREANVPAEIYHLKAGGAQNWPKLDKVIETVEAARRAGLSITADMYNYIASSTGLDASMPLWVQEGGHDAWVERLKEPKTRARVAAEMRDPPEGFENRLQHAGGADGVLLLGFRNPALRKYAGKTLAEVAIERGTPPEETAIDLVIEDDSRVTVAYFIMSEENIRKKIALHWVRFGSDAGAMTPEGVFLNQSTHPRAYGNFARLLGKYVREEKVISLEEAIQRLTSQPAENLKLVDRGRLAPGMYADIVIFDAAAISDHATFENPHQLATGVSHVFVNGVHTLKEGEHTNAKAGRVVRGPGWTGWNKSR